MERSAYLRQTATDWLHYHPCPGTQDNIHRAFVAGAEWADAHPQSPWKNVMTDEPQKDQDVFAHVPNLCGGEYCKLTYLGNYRWSQDEGEWTTEFYNNEVMWMPIPKFEAL